MSQASGLFDSPIQRTAPAIQALQQAAFSGADPALIAQMMLYGFRPNPFAAMGTQGQDEVNFMRALKGQLDRQLASYGPMASQISPNNPVAALPAYMQDYFAGAAPIFNSPASVMAAPGGTQGMFAQGGYPMGPLPNQLSPLIENYLRGLRPSMPDPNAINQAANAVAGQGALSGATAQPALPTTTAQDAAARSAPSTYTNPPGAQQSQEVSGGNTPIQQPPGNVAAQQSFSNQDARQLMAAALGAPGSSQQDMENAVRGYLATGSGAANQQSLSNAVNQYQNRPSQREQAAQALGHNVGASFSGLGTGIDNLIANVLFGLMGGRRS